VLEAVGQITAAPTSLPVAPIVGIEHSGLASSPTADSGSIADRMAVAFLRACESPSDLRTIGDWARCLGVSYTSLVELVRLAGIQPRAARDFARILRAVVQAGWQRCEFQLLLDVADVRTLRQMSQAAGLPLGAPPGSVSVDQFLRSQQFLRADGLVLRKLRSRIPERMSSRGSLRI
jgi:hypothetical protein